MSVQDTLKQRKSIYGDYRDVLAARSKIMEVIKYHYELVNGSEMPKDIEIGFNDLVLKLVRAAGRPEYKDSFHDLAGYAMLMEKLPIQKSLFDVGFVSSDKEGYWNDKGVYINKEEE